MRLYHMLDIVYVTLSSTLFFAQTISVTPQQGSPVTITSVRVSDIACLGIPNGVSL